MRSCQLNPRKCVGIRYVFFSPPKDYLVDKTAEQQGKSEILRQIFNVTIEQILNLLA